MTFLQASRNYYLVILDDSSLNLNKVFQFRKVIIYLLTQIDFNVYILKLFFVNT